MNIPWDIVLSHPTAMPMLIAVSHYLLTQEMVPDPPEVLLLMEHLKSCPVATMEIRRATARDCTNWVA